MQMIEFGLGRKYIEARISFIFFEIIIYFMASSQDFAENHHFNVILLYCKQIVESCLFRITYLHTTCTVF